MIIYDNNCLVPNRLYLLLRDRVHIRVRGSATVEYGGSIADVHQQDYFFNTIIGTRNLKVNNCYAEILVFKNARERMIFQDKEDEEILGTKSEQLNCTSNSEKDEVYSVGFAPLPQNKPQPRMLRNGSQADTSSTTMFRENQSTTSENAEQLIVQQRGRKGSDPLIYNSKSQKRTIYDVINIKDTELEIEIKELQSRQEVSQVICQYLQNEFDILINH